MDEAAQPDWTPTLRDTWQRIAAHDFDPPVILSFTARLARDMGWTEAFARGAIGEYRRFCLLTRLGVATPSEEVDAVWHLHLTYTRDYWDRWCRALGAPLHHDPTVGGAQEQARYCGQYADTLARYERLFGPPPELYWPGISRRFATVPRYRTLDASREFTLPRPRTLLRWIVP